MFGLCPCVNARDGAFVLAFLIYAAVWSPIFLGADFSSLLATFLNAPRDTPLIFAMWGMGIISGLVLVVAGIRENLRDGDGAPVFSSVATICACAFAIHHQWYLPRTISPGLPYLCQGIYVALIAACCANLCMAWAAHVRRAKPAAVIDDRPPLYAPDETVVVGFPNMLAAYVERDAAQTRQIETLTAQLERCRGEEINSKQIVAEHREMKALLAFPGVRTALLHALHSDHHAGATETERRTRDETVNKLTTIYKRIGTKT